jgi:hypothetical protein
VLVALAVPQEVADAVEALWQPGRTNFPPNDLGDILTLANHLTPILSPLQRPDVQVLPADPQAVTLLAEILDQSGEEMGALTAALRY